MAAASSSSDLSSLRSYVTANDPAVNKSTAASSPVQEKSCPYRDARQLPRELKEHCQIFLEEQLYICAINLLNSIACSGASKRSPSHKPVPVPPPSHLALLSTLIVHPIHTTRADKQEHLDVSSQALEYLRNLLAIVGPVNADFRTAFQFQSAPRWGGRRWNQHGAGNDTELSDDDASGDDERLRGKIANESSLWNRGQDFWSTIGWAFNCSTLYPHRWRYWKVWLEFMLDVLEHDWNERERRDQETHQASESDGDAPLTSREESMINMYMDQQGGRQNGIKGIIKALFADGSEMSSLAFREVFEKEPRGPRKQSKKRKREQVLDLENDKFGDYFDDESISSGVSEPPTPQKPKDARRSTAGAYSVGMIESVDIRLRFFRLLSAVTYAIKRSELNRLYEEFSAAIKLLPLQTFSLFVTQRPNALIPETHITLTKELFHLLLPASYKNPAKVDREADARGNLTSAMLEHCYICYPANTVAMEDNAKLSLVVESAIQLLWRCDMMEYSETFAAAVEKGIKLREAKGKKRRTGKLKGDETDALAQDVLANSAMRIRILLEALESFNEMQG
ncbi:Fc.00g111540.m01.CDS01 [Cosmosporella sp. VM-42]